MGKDTGIGLTGDGRADNIANPKHHRSALPSQANGSQRVCSLTALADCQHYVSLLDNRVTVPELRGILHLHRNTAEAFNQMLADEGGMP